MRKHGHLLLQSLSDLLQGVCEEDGHGVVWTPQQRTRRNEPRHSLDGAPLERVPKEGREEEREEKVTKVGLG